jgi:hypothetical protein
MAYAGTVATRPLEISGGLQTWTETTDPNALLRSAMDSAQTIKVRRRVTHPIRMGQASVTVPANLVALYRQWFEVSCQGGVLPTRFIFPPDCLEQIWRFSTPPTYDWVDAKACRISFSLEKLPQWVD